MAKSKYKNVKVQLDGKTFDSKKEAARYAQLKLLLAAGEIRDLQCQPSYRLEVNGMLICRYRADFVYVDCKTGETLVEDCKGYRTDVYKLKRKLMKACHGIDVLEV